MHLVKMVCHNLETALMEHAFQTDIFEQITCTILEDKLKYIINIRSAGLDTRLPFAGPVKACRPDDKSKLHLVTLVFGDLVRVPLCVCNHQLGSILDDPAFVPAWCVPAPSEKDESPTLARNSETTACLLNPACVKFGGLHDIADEKGSVVIPYRLWYLELADKGVRGESLVLTYRAATKGGKAKGRGKPGKLGKGGGLRQAGRENPNALPDDHLMLIGAGGLLHQDFGTDLPTHAAKRAKGSGKGKGKGKKVKVDTNVAHLLR